MNPLIVILNRVYLFLTKVKNQPPLFGAVCISTLLLYATLNNLVLLVFAFKTSSLIISGYVDFIEIAIIFSLVYYYAVKKKKQIVDPNLFSGIRNNLFVVFVIIFTVVSFVFLANFNRNKIFIQKRKEQSDHPRKQSLESRIKKWFE